MDIEKQCLTRISEGARESHNLQIALNSVIRAQKLERSPTASVSQEFANVLWDQREHKVAVQFLKDLIRLHFPDNIKSEIPRDHTQKALLLARLVIYTVAYNFRWINYHKTGLVDFRGLPRKAHGHLDSLFSTRFIVDD
jgi:ataxia telangiectasia mutated family protein